MGIALDFMPLPPPLPAVLPPLPADEPASADGIKIGDEVRCGECGEEDPGDAVDDAGECDDGRPPADTVGIDIGFEGCWGDALTWCNARAKPDGAPLPACPFPTPDISVRLKCSVPVFRGLLGLWLLGRSWKMLGRKISDGLPTRQRARTGVEWKYKRVCSRCNTRCSTIACELPPC